MGWETLVPWSQPLAAYRIWATTLYFSFCFEVMALGFTNQHYLGTILTHHILECVPLNPFWSFVLKLMKYFLKVLVHQLCFILSKDHRFSAFRSILEHEQSVRVYHEAKSCLLLNAAMRQALNYLNQGSVEFWVIVFVDVTQCFVLMPLSLPSILFPLWRFELSRLRWSSFSNITSILPSFWQNLGFSPLMLPFWFQTWAK